MLQAQVKPSNRSPLSQIPSLTDPLSDRSPHTSPLSQIPSTGHIHHWRPDFIQIRASKAYELDFYVQGLSPLSLFQSGVVLEIDGLQHFEQFEHARPLEANRASDVHKMEKVIEHGFSMVRHMARPIRLGETQWEALAQVVGQAGNEADQVIMLQDCPEYRAMAAESLTHLAHRIRYY